MFTNALRRRTFFMLLSLFTILSSISLSQTFRGTINGTITDPSGAAVSGARVMATDVNTRVVRDTISSGAGEFSFSDLPLSTYTIHVDAAGFQATEVTGVQALAGKVYTLPVKLNAWPSPLGSVTCLTTVMVPGLGGW